MRRNVDEMIRNTVFATSNSTRRFSVRLLRLGSLTRIRLTSPKILESSNKNRGRRAIRRFYLFLVIGFCSIGLWQIASAQNDGYPDSSFAHGGREAFARVSVPNFPIGAREMADGRLVLVGNCANTCMARLHTDGILDGTFGGGRHRSSGFWIPFSASGI